jgi:iron donor protein CyaY
MATSDLLDENVYRHLLDDTFARVDRAFEPVDHDLAESQFSQGTLTITIRNAQRIILSPQPSPRQLWVAFRDRAWHLNWQPERKCWIDDRGQGIDLENLLSSLTQQELGFGLTWPST